MNNKRSTCILLITSTQWPFWCNKLQWQLNIQLKWQEMAFLFWLPWVPYYLPWWQMPPRQFHVRSIYFLWSSSWLRHTWLQHLLQRPKMVLNASVHNQQFRYCCISMSIIVLIVSITWHLLPCCTQCCHGVTRMLRHFFCCNYQCKRKEFR